MLLLKSDPRRKSDLDFCLEAEAEKSSRITMERAVVVVVVGIVPIDDGDESEGGDVLMLSLYSYG